MSVRQGSTEKHGFQGHVPQDGSQQVAWGPGPSVCVLIWKSIDLLARTLRALSTEPAREDAREALCSHCPASWCRIQTSPTVQR